MTPREAVIALLEGLNAAGIEYMVTGSFATNLYAVPRSTQDIDFVVDAQPEDLNRFFSVLPKAIRVEPQTRFDTITFTHCYNLAVEGTPFYAEVFLITDDEHNQERFRRRRRGVVLGVDAHVPTPEDIVVQKIRWAARGRRSKDIDDIRAIIHTRHDALDWPYIESWCDRHGTRDLLEQLREDARQPPT